MSIFSTRSKPSTTPEEAPVTMTDTPTTPAPPSLYPSPSWQDSGRFAVPAELRQHYAAAIEKPEVEMAREEGKGKGFRVGRLFPPAEAERMAANGDGLQEVPEVRGDGWRRFLVPVPPEEWLHVRRMEEARKAQRQESRPRLPDLSTCVACGATAHAASKDITPRIGAPFRLGIRGPLCGSCADVAAVVLAEQEVRPGVTRRQTVAEAAGLAGTPRAEADKARVRALVEERAGRE